VIADIGTKEQIEEFLKPALKGEKIASLGVTEPNAGSDVSGIQTWAKKDGDFVGRDEMLAEIQSDKAMLTVHAEQAGVLKILVKAGETIAVGTVIASIDTSASAPASVTTEKTETKVEQKTETKETQTTHYANNVPSPSANKLMEEKGVKHVEGTGKDGRVTKTDVVHALNNKTENKSTQETNQTTSTNTVPTGERVVRREKMTMLRKKLAQRLVQVKNETAMLTTFNEVDMSGVMALRAKYKDKFKETHGVGLGFMSFFSKAVCEALKSYPVVNAQIDGDEIVFFDYVDLGIAVSTDRGLVVPILRNCEKMSLADIEKNILELATKARNNKLQISDMTNGTFTITNGGVFGSLMSTPILNPPQSGILGMHNIVQRPVAVDGKVEIRPMMYIALSYDHRIIDGKDSVSFLVKIKELLEDPARLLLEI